MRHRLIALSIVVCAAGAVGQEPVAKVSAAPVLKVAAAPDDSGKTVERRKGLYDSQDPLEVTLTTNIGKIRGDKGDNPPWRPATLSYVEADGGPVSVPLKARTRGIWRLKMCDFPPLRLNFSGATSKGTIFHKVDKPKLVSYCRDMDSYEQYILQEYQLYRIYNVLTPMSHKARLLKFSYADSGSGKIRAKRYGFLMEEPGALAARLDGKVLEQKGAAPADLDPFQSALFGVFQYFIGNTDFSVGGLHNVELFFSKDGSTVVPIAYDFDFAGVIDARYATPDERLGLRNVRQRLFRGYCADTQAYEKVFALFKDKKNDIYALYTDSIGKLMDRGTVSETLKYFDDFYETISNPRSAKRSIIESCIGPK
ncbi:MAG: hypothetical protein ACJ8AC_13495 [Gemmatimonadaceae bacterium]